MSEPRNERRRFEFEAELVAVNDEFEAPHGKNASDGAPLQFSITRGHRRRIARSRVKIARIRAKAVAA